MQYSTALGKRPFWVLLLLVPIACSQFGSGSKPDEMSVEEHEHAAGEHMNKAAEHEERFRSDVEVPRSSSRADQPGGSGSSPPDDLHDLSGYYWGTDSYNPTERHTRHAERHRRHAEAHASAARELETHEEIECSGFPIETRPYCPLIGQLASAEDVPGGVRIRLMDGVNVDAAVAHMRCHLAFARSKDRSGMDSCPLYLEGVTVSRVESSSQVDLLVDDDSALEQLRQRVHSHVELGEGN